jgi:hypothetical protein
MGLDSGGREAVGDDDGEVEVTLDQGRFTRRQTAAEIGIPQIGRAIGRGCANEDRWH